MRFRDVLFITLLLAHTPTIAQDAADKAAVTAAIDRWDRAWQVKDAKLATSDYAEQAH